MTKDEILAWVDAHATEPAVVSALADGRDNDLAVLMSVGRKKAVSTIGSYAMIRAFVPNGGALLSALKAASTTSDDWLWAWQALMDGRFDFGLQEAIDGWDQLSAVGATSQQIAALKAIPLVYDPVDVFAVSAALNERGRQ